MGICIICRKEKSNFNDEHVIPDSIQGYYHIYSVCTDCNSKMGAAIDNKLTNHKFIEFQRYTLGIKGKSGNIPNPFAGVHSLKDDADQKIRIELDSEGRIIPRLLPNIPRTISDQFTITIDKKDEKDKVTIIDKFLKRNGIPKDKVVIEETEVSGERPMIHASMKIDIHNFKLAILKIAYEFTVDQIPRYFDDSEAIKISQILFNADYEAMKKLAMFGDGFSKKILQPFDHLIDFENNNHYLILFQSPELGLLCFVNLFNIFSLVIRMSENPSLFADDFLVGKNDISLREFKIYKASEVLSQTYTPVQYRFQYFLPDRAAFDEFIQNNNHTDTGFYYQNGHIPFFNKDGTIAYSNIDDKLQQKNLKSIPKGDTVNQIITQFILDEELYIKLLPINKLFQVVSVRIEQYKANKL